MGDKIELRNRKRRILGGSGNRYQYELSFFFKLHNLLNLSERA